MLPWTVQVWFACDGPESPPGGLAKWNAGRHQACGDYVKSTPQPAQDKCESCTVDGRWEDVRSLGMISDGVNNRQGV